jgi:HAE1 family hydrophobic/amphiphilic exporter-1
VIYLFLDKYSGTGPMSDEELAGAPAPAPHPVELKAVGTAKH